MQIASNTKAGFKYTLEHLRTIAMMDEMGLSIDGLERRGDSIVLSVELIFISIFSRAISA